MIYSFFLFTRSGACLYHEEWNRKPSKNREADEKLLFGLLFSLKSFIQKVSPKP